jgi:hypothetical protein
MKKSPEEQLIILKSALIYVDTFSMVWIEVLQ